MRYSSLMVSLSFLIILELFNLLTSRDALYAIISEI